MTTVVGIAAGGVHNALRVGELANAAPEVRTYPGGAPHHDSGEISPLKSEASLPRGRPFQEIAGD